MHPDDVSIALDVPETPGELYARAAGALRMPPVETWETFPFDGDLSPRALLPPVAVEEPRRGEGGVGCWRCAAPDSEFAWVTERWRLQRSRSRQGCRWSSCSSRGCTTASPASCRRARGRARMLIARIERAIRSIGEIGRVHVCRWGDGGEHLHWWFMARPARLPQLIGSFAAIWDDILPPTPEDVWRANIAAVVTHSTRQPRRPAEAGHQAGPTRGCPASAGRRLDALDDPLQPC